MNSIRSSIPFTEFYVIECFMNPPTEHGRPSVHADDFCKEFQQKSTRTDYASAIKIGFLSVKEAEQAKKTQLGQLVSRPRTTSDNFRAARETAMGDAEAQ
jgi:hypothetical protein